MSVCSANRCPKTIVIIITHYNTFLRFQQWMVYNPRDPTQSYIYKQDSLTDLSTLLITEEKSVLKNQYQVIFSMFYRKCEVKNLFACVFIYNQKGAMSDSIPYALLVYIGLIVFYLEAPVHVTYWFDRSLAMKSPSLNGMEFKHKIGSLWSVFHLYFRNMYSA